jgi:hypothetical protein
MSCQQETKLLKRLWVDIGLTEEECAQRMLDLDRRVATVFEEALQRERITKQEMEERLERDLRSIAEMTAALQMSSVEVVLNDEVASKSLREKLELVSRDVHALEERRRKNQRHLEQLHADLQNLCRALRVHERPSDVRFQLTHFREIGPYVSSERISQYREAVLEAQTLKATRDDSVQKLRKKVMELFGILDWQPVDAFDRAVRDNQLDSSTQTIEELQTRLVALQATHKSKMAEMDALFRQLEVVWAKLRWSSEAIAEFSEIRRTGLGTSVFEACYAKLHSCEEQLKEMLEALTRRRRDEIVELWNHLKIDQAERDQFEALHSTDYSEATLELHEAVFDRYKAKWILCKPILDMIQKREMIIEEHRKLEELAKDSSRLMSKDFRVAAQVREESKRRVAIDAKLKKITQNLLADLAKWRTSQGASFMYNGADYHDVIAAQSAGPARARRNPSATTGVSVAKENGRRSKN